MVDFPSLGFCDRITLRCTFSVRHANSRTLPSAEATLQCRLLVAYACGDAFVQA